MSPVGQFLWEGASDSSRARRPRLSGEKPGGGGRDCDECPGGVRPRRLLRTTLKLCPTAPALERLTAEPVQMTANTHRTRPRPPGSPKPYSRRKRPRREPCLLPGRTPSRPSFRRRCISFKKQRRAQVTRVRVRALSGERAQRALVPSALAEHPTGTREGYSADSARGLSSERRLKAGRRSRVPCAAVKRSDRAWCRGEDEGDTCVPHGDRLGRPVCSEQQRTIGGALSLQGPPAQPQPQPQPSPGHRRWPWQICSRRERTARS